MDGPTREVPKAHLVCVASTSSDERSEVTLPPTLTFIAILDILDKPERGSRRDLLTMRGAQMRQKSSQRARVANQAAGFLTGR